MEERIRYSTSHIHELGAEIQRRVLEGYILDTSSAFCLKRVGSAYVAHFLPTRESLDYDGFPLSDSEEKELEELYKEAAKRRLGKASASEEHLRNLDLSNFDDSGMNHCDRKAVDELNQLAEQAQELDMGYDSELTIHEKWEIDDQINSEVNAEKELAESESCGRILFTKEELEAMDWQDFKKLIDEAGIRGRRRQNLTRDYLKWQEEEKTK